MRTAVRGAMHHASCSASSSHAPEAPNGGIWALRNVAVYMQKTRARSAKAVSKRCVALMQLVAWINVRKLQPDLMGSICKGTQYFYNSTWPGLKQSLAQPVQRVRARARHVGHGNP